MSRITKSEVLEALRQYRENGYLNKDEKQEITNIMIKIAEIHEANDIYYFEFECSDCERKIAVETQGLEKLINDEDWPKVCPYCRCEKMHLNWRVYAKIQKAIHVVTCGGLKKTEDVGEIDYTLDAEGKYIDYLEAKRITEKFENYLKDE